MFENNLIIYQIDGKICLRSTENFNEKVLYQIQGYLSVLGRMLTLVCNNKCLILMKYSALIFLEIDFENFEIKKENSIGINGSNVQISPFDCEKIALLTSESEFIFYKISLKFEETIKIELLQKTNLSEKKGLKWNFYLTLRKNS